MLDDCRPGYFQCGQNPNPPAERQSLKKKVEGVESSVSSRPGVTSGHGHSMAVDPIVIVYALLSSYPFFQGLSLRSLSINPTNNTNWFVDA
jgi:hypothetical protein